MKKNEAPKKKKNQINGAKQMTHSTQANIHISNYKLAAFHHARDKKRGSFSPACLLQIVLLFNDMVFWQENMGQYISNVV